MISSGFKRTLLIDSLNGRTFIINNDQLRILEELTKGTELSGLKEFCLYYGISYLDIFLEFLNTYQLILSFEDEEACFIYTDLPKPCQFNKLNFNLVEYLVLEFEKFNAGLIKDILELKPKFILLRSFSRSFDSNILNTIEFIRTLPFHSVEFHANYSIELYSIISSDDFKFKFPNFFIIKLFSSIINTEILNGHIKIHCFREEMALVNCGVIGPKHFNLNSSHITESQHHNTCLNRKIAIDAEGNIKNCPSMAKSYGNIRDTKLIDVVKNPEFQKVWHIKKDEITKCKDCEFRHICTDCRAYLENPEDMYSAPLKCGYDPYTCTWEEWSTNPLKEKAIEYYGMEELVKK